MRLTLPSFVLASALLAAVAVTPKPASAAVLHVPFAFTVSGQNLPAGEYTVKREMRSNFVVLTNPEGRSFNWYIGPGDAEPGSTSVIMRFDPSDSGYALRNIQYGSMITPQLDKHQNDDRPVHVIRGE